MAKGTEHKIMANYNILLQEADEQEAKVEATEMWKFVNKNFKRLENRNNQEIYGITEKGFSTVR